MDLFGGINDIKNKIVRAVGNPETRFNEDALRMMRAVRFAVQLGFNIETNTFVAIKTAADNLKNISWERVSEEFQKIILSNDPARE